MDPAVGVLIALLALAIGAGVAFWVAYQLFGRKNTRRNLESRAEASRVLEDAHAEARELKLQAQDEALKIRAEAEAENRERRQELQRQERRLTQKEENLDRKIESLDRREHTLTTKEREQEQAWQEIEAIKAEQVAELQRVANLTLDEARSQLMHELEEEVRRDASRRVREIEQELRESVEEKARKTISVAIQRFAADVVSETTVSVVPLPSDEMKGRIIGREGRNIRALESATGVDLIIDDTPDAVTLSGFDPVRREVARVALSKLLVDGRIHPARIEEMVAKARQEVDAQIREEGEAAAVKAGVSRLHPEFIKLLGRLKFRYSYGQNVLLHTVEVANLCGMMAAELRADVQSARLGALLHDIGKSVDHEIEGPHALIGGEIARRQGLSPKIVNAIAAHHGDEEPRFVEAFLVAAADAISGARPGARRESLEYYVKRLEALEAIANSFNGVDRSFAIQAGREVRILVRPQDVDDLQAMRLARDITKRIEDSLEYPGQIKVTVIRETRAIEYAR